MAYAKKFDRFTEKYINDVSAGFVEIEICQRHARIKINLTKNKKT